MNFYLTKDGKLIYESSNLKYITKDNTKELPILNTKNIYVHANVSIDTKTISKMLIQGIKIFFFDSKNTLISVLSTINQSPSINLLNQVKAYTNEKRLIIAKIILTKAFITIREILLSHNIDLSNTILESNKLIRESVFKVSEYKLLLILEAHVRKKYYSYFNQMIDNENFKFNGRKMHPACDEINALISFGNAILYKEIYNAIIESGLSPQISYLHATNNRKSGLEYDLSELYKPLIVDRTIFSMIHLNEINKSDFHYNDSKIIINQNLKSEFILKLEKCLNTLKNGMSYRQWIKHDCVLIKKYVFDRGNLNSIGVN